MQLSTSTVAAPAHPILGGFPALLIDRGLISLEELAVAEPHAARERVELADALVTLGLASEADSYAALAASAGTDVINLEQVVSSELAVKLVPEKLARRHLVVPLQVDNRTLTYATCRPFSAEALSDLGFATGRRIKVVVATRSDVLKALDSRYPKPGELDVFAQRLRAGVSTIASPKAASGKAAIGTPASPDIEMCTDIIGRALALGAGEVCVEYGSQGGTIRYRVEGRVQSMPTLPVAVSQLIGDRFKIMARIGVAVRHRPQAGTFKVAVNGRPTEVRLSTQPLLDGERLTMQIAGVPAAAGASTLAQSKPGRLRVLVTDDEPITRLLVKLLLERERFDVLEAKNGEEAIEIAQRERPDLLLIDLNMPVLDGYQAIHRLRSDPSLASLPIVVLTAEEGDSVERRVLELGANDYLVKPFEPAVLIARVNAVFGRLKLMAA